MNQQELSLRFETEVIAPLKNAFVGKDEIIDLLAIGLAASENLFLLGPPGTAKSALVHEFGRRLHGRTFDYLLTRFTEPNEIFGPFDIRKLRDGELVTNTEGMLPEADLVFLDELLNANSAILNSLLMALNERVFRRGRETRRLPALMFVSASNHLPEEQALKALFDRFLLRVHCANVPDESLPSVLDQGWRLETRTDGSNGGMSVEDIRLWRMNLREIELEPVKDAYLATIRRLRAGGLALSDRRAVKLQRVIAASALICGRPSARVSDLWVLRHIWDTEEQRGWVRAIVDEAVRKDKPASGDHPRSHGEELPDPEALALELERLSAEWDSLPSDLAGDRLNLISTRIEWIQEVIPRDALREKANQLWSRCHSST